MNISELNKQSEELAESIVTILREAVNELHKDLGITNDMSTGYLAMNQELIMIALMQLIVDVQQIRGDVDLLRKKYYPK